MAHIFGDPPDPPRNDYITLGGIFASFREGIILAKILVFLIFLPFWILGKILKRLDPILAAGIRKMTGQTPDPPSGEPPNLAKGLVDRDK